MLQESWKKLSARERAAFQSQNAFPSSLHHMAFWNCHTRISHINSAQRNVWPDALIVDFKQCFRYLWKVYLFGDAFTAHFQQSQIGSHLTHPYKLIYLTWLWKHKHSISQSGDRVTIIIHFIPFPVWCPEYRSCDIISIFLVNSQAHKMPAGKDLITQEL